MHARFASFSDSRLRDQPTERFLEIDAAGRRTWKKKKKRKEYAKITFTLLWGGHLSLILFYLSAAIMGTPGGEKTGLLREFALRVDNGGHVFGALLIDVA